jgi:hypothetical protein
MNNGTQKHTPGPWKASSNPGRPPTNWFVEKPMQGEDRFHLHIVAEIPNHSTQAEADARLLASAPDLLAALRELLAIGEGGVVLRNETGKPTWSALDAVKSIALLAIAKAEGDTATVWNMAAAASREDRDNKEKRIACEQAMVAHIAKAEGGAA